jgi:hypothetical protein
MRTPRDQGALDLAILSQSRGAQNCYLAMAAMRPDPPRQQLDTPLTRIPLPVRLCSGRVPGVSLQKANPAPPDQRRSPRA